MKKHLDEKLCQDFPEIFKERHSGMWLTSMCWGFECCDGWEPLIRGLCESLMKIAKEEGAPPPVASQVKEKFGGLRFYVHSATERMWDAIANAEYESEKICEFCGEPGAPNDSGWIRTLCKKHRDEK